MTSVSLHGTEILKGWPYKIVAMVNVRSRVWVICERPSTMVHPFSVHEVYADNSCHHGSYCSTLEEAWAYFLYRSRLHECVDLPKVIDLAKEEALHG